MSKEILADAIEIRVQEISQLFNTLDPFPFRERDLDRNAEEFILGWALELPKDKPIRIIVHVPMAAASANNASELQGALVRYFEYRAGVVARDINELFRVGRTSLAIGFAVLVVCVIATQALSGRFASPIGRFIEESFIIIGWVANWKPIEIFLYDWWPIFRRLRLYRRLAAATVELKAYQADNLVSARASTATG
jgi:hypothetical protein